MSTAKPIVIVTGAAGHIGQAIARELSRRGVRLSLVDQKLDETSALAAELDATNQGALAVHADITSDQDVSSMVDQTIEHFGAIHGVINNAGIEGPVMSLEDLDLAEVQRVFDINLFSIMRVLRESLPHLKESSGRIVNIASGAGLRGASQMVAYNSSKHAVVGLTRSLALETAEFGIPVNAVCPGTIESPMMGRIETELSRQTGVENTSFVPQIPMGRYGYPEEVASLVAYLLLDAPVYISGTTLVVDGALYA